jgi:hypothetical protein
MGAMGATNPYVQSSWSTSYQNGVNMKTIKLSNGDTDEWTRLDFDGFSEQGKIVKAVFDLAIDKSSRTFDSLKKCWYIKSELVAPFMAGVQKLIKMRTLNRWIITDERVKLETFEEFFAEGQGAREPQAKTLQQLLREFSEILIAATFPSAQEPFPLRQLSIKTPTLAEAKKFYRLGAVQLHPDRNNGDGTRMSELNAIWSELQSLLK